MEQCCNLKGKVVLVAGGAKNLGGAISKAFAKEGANLVVHYNSLSSKKDAEETIAFIKNHGGDGIALQADFMKVAEIEGVFSKAKEYFGGIDIAINTVGKALKKPIVDISEEDFDRISTLNNKSAFFFIREAGKNLNKNGRICTILTSLLSAFTGYYSSYVGNKAAVEHYTRAAAKEFSKRGISVTAVGPGPMDTPFLHEQESLEDIEYLKNSACLSEFSKTGLTEIENIVPLVKFLVTDGWWVNGQTILSNGGLTVR